MDKILIALISFGSGGLLIGFAVFWFLQHPEIVKTWASMLVDLLSLVFKNLKYKRTKLSLESKLNSFAEDMAEFSDIDTSKVKIHWNGQAGETSHELEENEVVLVMRDRGSENQNFVHAAQYYVSHMLLWKAKFHISKKQGQAIDVYTTKMLIESKSASAYRLFMESYFRPLLQDEKIKKMVNDFTDIDESGFYTNILLKELSYLGTKTMLVQKDSHITEEVTNLIAFLHRFATREVGDDSVSDEFIGSYCKCSIKIVSTAMVRLLDKADGPARRVSSAFEHGIENVYVIGPTDMNGKNFVNKVCASVLESQSKCEIIEQKTFKGKIVRNSVKKSVDTYFVQIQNPTKIEYAISQNSIDSIDNLRGLTE